MQRGPALETPGPRFRSPQMTASPRIHWHKVLDHGDFTEGRVTTVPTGTASIQMTHHEGRYGALTKRCTYQGRAMGEGAIEEGLPRCPWHGRDSQPKDGERKVVAAAGDGSFSRYMAEVTTAVRYCMNICRVLLNNSELGKVSKEQRPGNRDVWRTDLRSPSFSEFARNCGAKDIRVERPADLVAAIAEALAHDGPGMAEVRTVPELI